LGRFVPTRKQDNQFSTAFGIVNPVSRTEVDLEFADYAASREARRSMPAEIDARPADRVNRDFKVSEPNRLWVADLTYVVTWRGFVYVALVIDAFPRTRCLDQRPGPLIAWLRRPEA
jgi:hypothetical protein